MRALTIQPPNDRIYLRVSIEGKVEGRLTGTISHQRIVVHVIQQRRQF